jgi:phosphoglycerate dehydrogenase-like enzyme
MPAESPGPREIRTVLCTLVFEPDEIDQLRRAFAPAELIEVHPFDNDGIALALERADVAVVMFDIDERFLAAPHLRWVHCDHAGLNRSARPEVFEKGLIVTGSAGRSAPALAQHAFYFALALTFDARSLLQRQAAHEWGGIPGYEHRRALHGKTLGIVGFGNTGREMAALGKAFGMRVVAYRRSSDEVPATVDRMLSVEDGDTLDLLLDESDVVMLAVALSDATHHLFGAEQFERMKDDAYLVNLARGPIVDHEALIRALRDGQIVGAGLDVTDPEPLPADSPLWDMPNVLITPHMTPKLPERTQRSIDVIVENIGRYRRGEPMRNALTPDDVFTER